MELDSPMREKDMFADSKFGIQYTNDATLN